MKNKGFTLIELLAVIVILAIIALIATPIILGIINDTKKESAKISAENYIDGVEQAVIRENLKGEFKPSKCTITEGVVICEGEFAAVHCDGTTPCINPQLKVEIDGEKPIGGTIYFSNGSVAQGTELIFGSSKYVLNDKGELELGEKEEEINHLAKENVKAADETTKTTGEVPVQDVNGNIVPGSEFKIKVNADSDYLTFFVLSNEGDYVNLIAQQNITPNGTFTSELQDGDEWSLPSTSSQDNRYGPQNVYTYLSIATNNWTNIPIIESFTYEDEGHIDDYGFGYQSIITKLNEGTGEYITTITPLSTDYGNPVTYKNMRSRLPYISEITTNTTCKLYQRSNDIGKCPLWMVNYLYSSSYYTSTKKVNSTGSNGGYWILSSMYTTPSFGGFVYCDGYVINDVPIEASLGTRPVITILKSDLLRIME